MDGKPLFCAIPGTEKQGYNCLRTRAKYSNMMSARARHVCIREALFTPKPFWIQLKPYRSRFDREREQERAKEERATSFLQTFGERRARVFAILKAFPSLPKRSANPHRFVISGTEPC